jgi:hypothetical protein
MARRRRLTMLLRDAACQQGTAQDATSGQPMGGSGGSGPGILTLAAAAAVAAAAAMKV